MKTLLMLTVVLYGQYVSAQSYVEVAPNPFTQVWLGAIDFSDIDGDGDDDVIISGNISFIEPSIKLYSNENGVFTQDQNAPFQQLGDGAIKFSDIDGDGDEDLLITGLSFDESTHTKLYSNDGGVFTEILDTPFQHVFESSIAFADIDGDGDEDALITGSLLYDVFTEHSCKLYVNEAGVFSEVQNTPFDEVEHGSIDFSDIDNDGDLDVLITGRNTSLESIAKLYTNDSGVFTEVLVPNIQGVEESDVAFSDIDGDGDEDLLVTGQIAGIFEPITKLYINEGGDFTEVNDTPFDDIYRSSVAFGDVDGDGDPDLIMSGKNASDELITKLYINTEGTFTEVLNTPFTGLWWSEVAFSDIDNDGDLDLIISGLLGTNSFTKLYTNEGQLTFIEKCGDCLHLDFALYPNPSAEDYITINYPSKTNGQITTSIFDLQGRLISQQKQRALANQTFTIDTSALSQGTYVLQLVDGERMGSREFVVQ